MKILFLGTSAGWPLPRLGCRCPICTSTDPKDKRLRPSILINKSILIDPGPDFYQQMISLIPLKSLNTIFISHIHPDHYFGLWDVAKIYGKKPTVYLSTKNKKSLIKRINDFTITSLLQAAKTFQPDQKIQLAQLAQSDQSKKLSITPFLVDHSTNTETFGFLVEEKASQGNTSEVTRSTKYHRGSSDGGGIGEQNTKIIYIPDFRDIPPNSLKYLKNANLAILDGSNFQPAGPARWGHMPMQESIKLAKKLKIKKIYFTHIGHGPKMATHKDLEEKVQKAGGQNFYLAYDGLKLEIC